MTERLPDNLATLYDAFSKEAIEGLFSGETYTVDGIEFVCQYAPGSTAERFFIVKPPAFVEYFIEFSKAFRGGSIFELGIAEGGSTALLALVAEPRRLVAVDLEPERLEALDEFVAQRGLTDVVHPYYGVDQADAARLREIVDTEFGAHRLDLVLDDASHDLDFTRSSFETLFPYVRSGGTYTIEDWTADIRFRDAVGASLRDPNSPARGDLIRRMQESAAQAPAKTAPKASLSQLAIELVLAVASSSDAVAEVTVNEHWVMVRRGPAELDPATFRIADLYRDYFGFLPTEPEPGT